ncbi:MAG: metallophosphoesterase [Desulfotomaculales bacterium]
MGETVIAWEKVFTVGTDHAVITWETPDVPGETTVYIGPSRAQLERRVFALRETHHRAEVTGLKPGTRYWYQVETNGVRGPLGSFRTLTAPGGSHLFSFALFSDCHINAGIGLGDPNERYFGKLLKYARELLLHGLKDACRRGVDLAFMPGDITEAALPEQYKEVRDEVLPAFGTLPCYVCPGNHDKYERRSPGGQGIGARGFREYLGVSGSLYKSVGHQQYRFLLLDTAVRDIDHGWIDAPQVDWLSRALSQNCQNPVFLVVHHPVIGPDLWHGLLNPGAFRKAVRAFPNIQAVFCGHMHRCVVAFGAPEETPYIELPATVQFPCGYAIVRVYESGFTYNAYKVGRPDLVDKSRNAIGFGAAGQAIYTRYAAGGVGDRNLARTREGLIHRPVLFEVFVTVRRGEARELCARVQPLLGAAVTPAEQEDRVRVVFGRHASWADATDLRRALEYQYGLRVSVSREGGYTLPPQFRRLLGGTD